MYDLETLTPISLWETERGMILSVAFSPDSKLIASTCKTSNSEEAESIAVWELGSSEQITSLIGHKHSVTTLCFSPCGQFLASGGEDGTVYLWDVTTWQMVKTYTDYGKVYRIIPSYTSDGILRATIINYNDTGPATISVRNLESDEILFSDQVWGNTTNISYIGEWGNTVQFSYGTQLAYECRHEYINVWTAENPYKRQFTHSPISFPTLVIFSGDGKTLAVKHHHEGVVLWDIESKRSRPAIKEKCVGKNQFVYKTNSGNLYAASIIEYNVTLWNADDDSSPLINAIGRKYWSAHPVLSPTGTLFAYTDEVGTLKVYDVQSGEIRYELKHPLEPEEDDDDEDDRDTIEELEFSYDGQFLLSESSNRKQSCGMS